MVPSRSPSRISSRTAALRRGSRLPSTATVTPAWRPTAGVQAVAWVASSERTQKTRRRSAPRLTASLTAVSSVAAMTYHASSRSASSKPRWCQVTSPAVASPSTDGVTCGDTTTTSAPAAISCGHPPLGHLAAADHNDPATGEHQPGRVRRGLVHVSIIAEGYRARDRRQSADYLRGPSLDCAKEPR